MTTRSVCLPMCEYCESDYDYICKKAEPTDDEDNPNFAIIGDPCPFDVGFQVLDREQWAAVEKLFETACNVLDYNVRMDILDAYNALKKSEEGRE